MLFKKKNLIYIIIFFIILTLVTPTLSIAFDEDSVYVWSNFSSSVSTSISPSTEEQELNNNDSSRKFFRYYFWKCSINGSKNRYSSL